MESKEHNLKLQWADESIRLRGLIREAEKVVVASTRAFYEAGQRYCAAMLEAGTTFQPIHRVAHPDGTSPLVAMPDAAERERDIWLRSQSERVAYEEADVAQREAIAKVEDLKRAWMIHVNLYPD